MLRKQLVGHEPFSCIAIVLFLSCVLSSTNASAQSTHLTSKARAKKGDFDAAATIACAQNQNEDLGVCAAKIARGIDGDASIVIKFANGFARTLYFHAGVFTRADATMSGVGTDTNWKTEEGVHYIRVDDQRFQIPVAFVAGESE